MHQPLPTSGMPQGQASQFNQMPLHEWSYQQVGAPSSYNPAAGILMVNMAANDHDMRFCHAPPCSPSAMAPPTVGAVAGPMAALSDLSTLLGLLPSRAARPTHQMQEHSFTVEQPSRKRARETGTTNYGSDDDEGEEAVSRLRFRRPQNPFSAAPARRPNPTSSPQNSLGSTKDSEMEDGLDWEAQGAFEREQYLQRTSDFEE